MDKFNIILFFCTFGIYLVETQDLEPLTLEEESAGTELARKSLAEIQSNEILPMVYFKAIYMRKVYRPNILQKVTLLDGKMINGTEFFYKKNYEQIFLCPNEDPQKKCLVRKNFNENERLRCALEATPDIESENTKCGYDESGTLYKSLYQICDGEEFRSIYKSLPSYKICHNAETQKTLFTIHTISCAELLNAKLLLREREVNFTMMKRNEFPVFSNHNLDDVELNKESTSQYSTTKPGYQWQKLVPSEDMALGIWRKTTFQETNTALQHEQLINLWNKISGYVRSEAIKVFIRNQIPTYIYTGVFDGDSAYKDNEGDQLSNIWIKLVISTKSSLNDVIPQDSYGLAILMNNYVDTETNRDSDAIKKYCVEDLCIGTLSNAFEQIKGHVRCCFVDKKIVDLFKEININLGQMKELHIPNVNVSEDQETLEDDSRMTDEQAANSIRQLERNEILPLILLQNPNYYHFQIPSEIETIETKNKRIVNGSKFHTLNPIFQRQLFFCPQENSYKNCLAPRAFSRFEPLQCTKEAIPVVRKFGNERRNKCGINDTAVIYKVIYEICKPRVTYKYEPDEIQLYEICYDEERKKIVYAHHTIMSEKLLHSKLLFREREPEFYMMTDGILPLSNYQKFKKMAQMEKENSTSSTDAKKSEYKLQKLVPSEDMAFALWKKSTYRYVNVALQHESLIPFWNDIKRYIKENANRNGKITVSNNSIYTGALYTQFSDDKPEIWFKVIYNDKTFKGIVILMNNFLTPKTDDSTSSNAKENTLKKYCDDSICEKEFQNKFEQIGGQVWCCSLTKKIAQQLGIPNIYTIYEVLYIRNIISIMYQPNP